MDGLMMDVPLTLTHFFERAERYHHRKTITTATRDGLVTTTYGEWAERTRKLGTVFDQLGLAPDARVGTFGWNSADHLSLYFAAPCSGRVCHTLNIRLFPEQLTYIVNHAGDEAIFVDRSLVALLAPLVSTFTTVRHLIVMDDGGPATDATAAFGSPGQTELGPDGPQVHDLEALLDAAEPLRPWPRLEEGLAASLCYTSGTTGHPKGALYSHRSTYLHTMALMQADSLGVCERDVILPVVPMFHVNAWGLAHAAVCCGANLVMPGPDLSAPAITELLVGQRVTVAAGVPTIWMGVLPLLEGRDTSALRVIPCGGSAVPKALSEGYRTVTGKPILQAWGMTETSPIAALCQLVSTFDGISDEEAAERRTFVGRVVAGVEMRIVDSDTLEERPWDGVSSGELQVRGPWVIREYYDDARSPESFSPDGWLKTGDVAVVDGYGYVKLVDRSKDVIKSGGEWISSVDIENELMAHPKVAEAAVIGINHPRWQERPLACVVLRPGEAATKEDILAFLDGRIAKWWMPDDVVFIEEIPRTSTGKFSKKDLRSRFIDHVLPA
ncbi:MAG: long-chain fatty acid--CoA ligase [Acidimicrobiales bacterium]